jgi:prophage regulatory protein
MAALVYEKHELPGVTKLSMTTIEAEIRKGIFPRPRQLSPNRVGWLAREVHAWAESRPVSSISPPKNTSAKKPRTRGPDAPT